MPGDFGKKRSGDKKGRPHRGEGREAFKKYPRGPQASQRSAPRFEERREPADDVCWGRQPVLDLIKNSPSRCTRLIIANNVRPPFLDELTDAARAGKVVYQMVPPEAVESLCPGVRHQGVGCRVTEVAPVDLEPFLNALPKEEPALIVVLDHVEDPHNLGAIVRSAEAAGAAAVVYSKRRSALPGGTVVKTSAGAALRLPMIAVVNVARTLEELQEAGFWVVGLEGEAEASLWGDALPDRTALVVGAEGQGLSRLVGEKCDQLLRIPIEGKVGSLNASVAAALGAFEWRRSR